jgi:hypothetical protein
VAQELTCGWQPYEQPMWRHTRNFTLARGAHVDMAAFGESGKRERAKRTAGTGVCWCRSRQILDDMPWMRCSRVDSSVQALQYL